MCTSHQPATPEPQEAPRIWMLDCLSITTLLLHGMPLEALREIVRHHNCRCCRKRLADDAWVVHAIHNACHTENPVSLSIEHSLHVRYGMEIKRVRSMDCVAVAGLLADGQFELRQTIGMVWGLLTDQQQEKRNLGRHLVLAFALRGAELCTSAARASVPVRGLFVELDRLTKQIAATN